MRNWAIAGVSLVGGLLGAGLYSQRAARRAEELAPMDGRLVDVGNGIILHVTEDGAGPPLLLIHGEADDNSGTFPIQSERFYAALKGHGATTRLVLLPHEAHGYRARESLLHMLWEMETWLDRHVKAAPATPKS